MGEIIIIHRDGTETRLQNKEATSKITRAEQRKQLLGEDVLNLTIQSSNPIPVEIGDRIQTFGSVYTVNQLPTISKTGTRTFEQTVILEGTQYELIDVQFILPGDTMYDNLTGNLDLFMDVLIENANRIYPGKWVKGTVPTDTETKTLSFTEKNCLEVLQTLCDEYKTEFEILTSEAGVRTVHIKQVGVQFPATFTYGRTGGLYQLTRQNVNNKNVVTRLYVYGSTKNLGNSYRNSRLCLPGKPKNSSYIEDAGAIALYGTKENTKVFDDIFPARYGTVTGLGTEKFIFYDTSMDFDLNETDIDGNTIYLIPDVSAKVRFTTGNLAGYEFDIHSYNHATKEIQIVPFVDESGYKFPSDTSTAFQIAVGDVYHFVDINLPATYITAAETKLETEGTTYYSQYKQPQVSYSLAIHPRFLEKYVGSPAAIPNIFALGDQIHIIDSDIGVDKNLRITAFTRDAIDPYKYNLTLSEAAYSKTILNRIISDIDDITDIIEMNNLADPFKARRNWMAAQELLNKIFDPEGYYYSEKIKPLSIETMMLQVGAKSQQFILQNTLFEPNYLADPNAINITGGQLIHYTIDATAIKTWNLSGSLITALTPTESYFVYAKCEVSGTNGIIIINSAQIKVDQDPMYYHFIIGHLSSVITNPDLSNPARILSLTYGSTTINGRFIRTGRIESSGGGTTYFDLDAGIIGGNIRFIHNGTETDMSLWADGVLTEIDDTNLSVTNLEDYVNIAFHDGVIEEAEAKAIEKYINQVNKEKSELEATFNKLYVNPLLSGTPKTNLLNAKITLFGDIDSLISTINSVIADGKVNPTEKTQVDNAFSIYEGSLATFKTRVEEANQFVEGVIKGAADNAQQAADDAALAASDAQNDATDALNHISNIISDNVLSAAEKPRQRQEWDVIYAEKAGINNQAASFGITTENTAYNDAFQSLANYLNAGVAWTTGVPTWLSDANLSIDTTIVGATYRTNWKNFYTAKTTLLQAISTKAKTLADTAQSTANTAKAITDKFGTSINGGLISTVTILLREATPEDGTPSENQTINTAGFSGIRGTNNTNPAIWAGGTYDQAIAGTAKVIIRHDGSGQFAAGNLSWDIAGNLTLTGTIYADSGTIGGWELVPGRLGMTPTAGSSLTEGLSLLNSFIKFYDLIDDNIGVTVPEKSYAWAGIGENVLSSIFGERALGRFENYEQHGQYVQKSRVDIYYTYSAYQSAGSPTPATFYYYAYDDVNHTSGHIETYTYYIDPSDPMWDYYFPFDGYLQSIQVTVYWYEWEVEPLTTNYGLIVNVKGAFQNVAILAKGDIVTNGMVSGVSFATFTPTTNQYIAPGDATKGGLDVIIVKFTNTNSGFILPSRNIIAERLGIGSDAFAFRIKIICSASSTQTGNIYGRTTEISGASAPDLPERLDNNGITQTGGLAMAKGDIDEFLLVWDKSTYKAYWLSSRH